MCRTEQGGDREGGGPQTLPLHLLWAQLCPIVEVAHGFGPVVPTFPIPTPP